MKYFSTFALIGVFVTPMTWFFTYLSLGGGHGDQFIYRILYPIPFLFVFVKSTDLFTAIRATLGVLILLSQYSVYGMLIDYSLKKESLYYICFVIVFHLVCIGFTYVT